MTQAEKDQKVAEAEAYVKQLKETPLDDPNKGPDLDDIKPGMKPETAADVAQAIRKALRDDGHRG